MSIVSACGYPSIPRLQGRLTPARLLRVLEWIADWPPDLFAVTWALLQRTGTYRFAVAPPEGVTWPPDASWESVLAGAARSWFAGLKSRRRTDPDLVRSALNDLAGVATRVSVEQLQHRWTWQPDSREWRTIAALLKLHAFADEASAGLGLGAYGPPMSARASHEEAELARARARFRFVANLLLATTGTLSRFPKHLLTVLPKLRTPQRGLSIRSMAHHLSVYAGEVNAIWRTVPFLGLRERSMNILLAPHPTEFSAQYFKQVRANTTGGKTRTDRFFRYDCGQEFPYADLLAALEEAERSVGPLDIIALPELAITEEELQHIYRHLRARYQYRSRLPAVLAGLRVDRRRSAAGSGRATPTSSVPSEVLAFDNQLVFAFFFAGKWYESRQQKHHRWCLDDPQIRQYGLAGVLPPKQLWWEAFSVGRRNQSFLLAAPWMCIAPLICEDLAQQDPLADLVRSVGPQLVMALLLDGPQLRHRWPGRYASVLADDPGSAVLTVTSAGIAGNSTPPSGEKAAERIAVGLWKDAARGWAAVETDPSGPAYHVLTISAQFREEFTLDGRSDHGATPQIELDQIRPLRDARPPAGPAPAAPAESGPARDPELRKLDLEELTRLVFALDHMMDFPDDAPVVAELAGGRLSDEQLDNLELWTCGRPHVLSEICKRINLRIGRRTSKVATRNHHDLIYALRTGKQYAEKMDRMGDIGVLSSPHDWARLLEHLQRKLRGVSRAELETPTVSPASAAGSPPELMEFQDAARKAGAGLSLETFEVARTEWLVSAVFHYLVRMRLDRQRRLGGISCHDHAALHQLEQTLQEGTLVDHALWDRIVAAFCP